MPLTDTAIKKIKPDTKPVKFSDGKGLYLLVNPVGSKLWRWKYRVLGKDMSKYRCCQGYADCMCFKAGSMGERSLLLT